MYLLQNWSLKILSLMLNIQAAMAGSIGIIMAIGVSAILGWFLILGLLFSIQDLDTTIGSETGQPVAQIFLDTVGEKGAIVLMVSNVCLSCYSHWVTTIQIDHSDWRHVFLRVDPLSNLPPLLFSHVMICWSGPSL